jgi:uracil-DNA glycosylase
MKQMVFDMNFKINETWLPVLQDTFKQPYFENLTQFVNKEYLNTACYPPKDQIFNAFDACKFEDVKVVIIGQDPYHGPGQANGLCFSVNDGIKHPPSLVNIFKEIQSDLGLAYPVSGNLERWAKQGVFLLNTTLTVRANLAASHANNGWEVFTDEVIKQISKQKAEVVFLLWGSHAIKKQSLIDASKHCILTAPHPSPLSSYRGFFGCKHFSKANQYLHAKNLTAIDWS